MNTDELRKWILDNNIEKRTIEIFWNYFNHYIEEIDDNISNVLKTIDSKLLTVEFYKVSLSTIYNYTDFVNVYLNVLFKNRHIGNYEAVYTLSGEHSDDFLNFDDINYLSRLSFVEERCTEIAQIALSEGLKPDLIAKITGLNIEQVEQLKE